MIILDTNVISEAARSDVDPKVSAWLDSQKRETLFAASISVAEVFLGVATLPDGRKKERIRRDMTAIFDVYLSGRILSFDDAAARAYATIVSAARTKGRSILIADGQIASIAAVHGFTVATRDTAPFDAAGVPFIDPWSL